MQKNSSKVNGVALGEGVVLLHLSDLHFGDKNRFQGRDLKGFGHQTSQAVKNALQELKWPRPVDLVVISGDIAEVAKPKEFEQGVSFLSALMDGLSLTPSRAICIPGNHDISWPSCKKVDADQERLEFDDTEYQKQVHTAKFEDYNQFFLQKFYRIPDANLAQLPGRTSLDVKTGAYLHDFVIDGIPISLAGLNTSERETHKVHGGELGREQAEALIGKWNTEEYRSYFKIAVAHHNPLTTPSENLQWSEEWLNRQIAEKKLDVTADWLRHYTTDMAGFKNADLLKRVVRETGVHLVLHGHHHTSDGPISWFCNGGVSAPILSVGSFGLNHDQIPTNQPLTCQLLFFQTQPEAQLIAAPLAYDPNYSLPRTLDKGQFCLNLKSEANYSAPLNLPAGWKTDSQSGDVKPTITTEAPSDVARFITYYRNSTVALYSSYDLKNLGVLPAEMNKTVNPQLDDLYLPLRFDEKFDINKSDQGKRLDLATLLDLLTPVPSKLPTIQKRNTRRTQIPQKQKTDYTRTLTISGAAGTGKTTWMRHTFRSMRKDERTLPFLIELRALAKFWDDEKTSPDHRSIEAYLEHWVTVNAPATREYGVKLHDLLQAAGNWYPVLLVDGWDELGDLGAVVREKLLGMIQNYSRLIVIASSRPYGTGRPSGSDGFLQLQLQPSFTRNRLYKRRYSHSRIFTNTNRKFRTLSNLLV